jgi:hypothetical protein
MDGRQNFGSEDGKAFMSSAVTFSLEPNETKLKKKNAQHTHFEEEKSASFESLHSRSADAVATSPKKAKRRRVRKAKDPTGMSSLYEFEAKEEEHNHILSLDALQCEHCGDELDIGQMLSVLNPHIERVVQQRLAVRERKLREEVVLEFRRRRESSKTN